MKGSKHGIVRATFRNCAEEDKASFKDSKIGHLTSRIGRRQNGLTLKFQMLAYLVEI